MAGGGSDGAELSGRLEGGRGPDGSGLDRREAAAAAAEAEPPKKKTSRDVKETLVWLLAWFPLKKVSEGRDPIG